MTRTCSICGQLKPVGEFNFRNRLLGKRHTYCRECQRSFKRSFYERTRQAYKIKSAAQKAQAIQRNQQRLQDYLSAHACVDCGESDPIVLEFDHLGGKDRDVTQLARDGAAWERIKREIAKCQVRCGNCHRIKTAKEKDWYRHLGL